MKNIILLLTLSAAIFSCGISKQNYTEASVSDTNTVVKNTDILPYQDKNTDILPYQDPDRLTGSVSPRAEEASPYQGSQGPNGTNNDILEPLRSRSTRSYNSHPTNYNNGGGDRGTMNSDPLENNH
jgi:hypothetical protein